MAYFATLMRSEKASETAGDGDALNDVLNRQLDDVKQLVCEGCGCNTLIATRVGQKDSYRRGSVWYFCPNCSAINFSSETPDIKWVKAEWNDLTIEKQYVQPTTLAEAEDEIARLRKRVADLDAQVIRYWESKLNE